MKPIKPEDLFRAEKERASTDRNSQHARLLAEAKAAFDKLMAEGQAARKSGRPRKHPLPPLKTSSSRPVVKPPLFAPAPTAKFVSPAAPAPVVVAVKPPSPVKAAPPASAKHAGKAVIRAVAKRAAPAKKAVKASSKSGRKAKAASKAKSSKKR